MRKYINGKKYDSDTAKWVATYERGYRSDFGYVREILCRKRTGEYFLYGEGGPASKYCEMVSQNCWTGGELITPMTEEDAREWAQSHLDADKVDEIFADKRGAISVGDFLKVVEMFGFDSNVATAVWNTMEENPNNRTEFETVYTMWATGKFERR